MTTATLAHPQRPPMPGMGVYNLKLGMWIFLLSEVMFFSGLIGSYVILRFAHPDHFP
jgi:heme/copper-type cytochrome/quinol oxidase subunit 3